ncbi:MAG: SRPBCC family protein [Alphaproteobacteria bacterium]
MKTVLSLIGIVLAVFVIVVLLQPSEFHVERSIEITAKPNKIFPHINNLKKANVWSPWAKLDPNIKQTYSGPEQGVGAQVSWTGNNQVGEGTMTIVESKLNQLVRNRLDFLKPMEGTSTADFTLKTEGNKTKVTWSIYGHNNFMAKAMSLIMNCDKMIGEQFEKGLADLKTTVEAK